MELCFILGLWRGGEGELESSPLCIRVIDSFTAHMRCRIVQATGSGVNCAILQTWDCSKDPWAETMWTWQYTLNKSSKYCDSGQITNSPLPNKQTSQCGTQLSTRIAFGSNLRYIKQNKKQKKGLQKKRCVRPWTLFQRKMNDPTDEALRCFAVQT